MAANVNETFTESIGASSLRQAGRSDTPSVVTVAEGVNAVEHVAHAWQFLEDNGAVRSPFQSLAAARATTAAHISNGQTPRIVVVRQANRPVVIFPTVIENFLGIPAVRFLGDNFNQYGDVVATSDAGLVHLHKALEVAADERIASIALFRKVRADSKLSQILSRCAVTVSKDAAPFVDLQHPETASSHYLRELRRLRRRLASVGDIRFEVLKCREIYPVLRETLEFKRDWLIERGLPSTFFGKAPWEQVLFDLAHQQCGRCDMLIARLSVGDTTVATEIGFADDRTWFAYMGALAPAFAKFGSGHVLMDELKSWCRIRGLKTYDLLPPQQPYKLTLTSQTVPVCDYALALGAAGMPAMIAARLIPHAKKLAALAPLSLRRRLVRRHLQIAKT